MAPTLGRVVQRFRINILRVLFVPLLLSTLVTHSAWQAYPQALDIIELLGTLLIVFGVLGRFWAILYAGGRKNTEVLRAGPYSMCRHPLYLFSTIAMTGFGVMMDSLVQIVLWGGTTFLVLMLTAKAEEAFLIGRFGQEYRDYAARVPMIIPSPSLFSSPRQFTFDTAHLRRNFMDALVFLMLLPLAELIKVLHGMDICPSLGLF